MTEPRVALRRYASLITFVADERALPYVSLDVVESLTGRLRMPDGGLPQRSPAAGGVASVQRGDVLFGKLRPYLAKSWLVDGAYLASTELLAIRPETNKLESGFLAYVALSRPFLDWSVATSDGTKMPRTSWDDMREYRLWLPPLPTQRAIAAYLDAETVRIDALIAKKRRMMALLKLRFWTTVSTMTRAAECITLGRDKTGLPPRWLRLRLRRCFSAMDYGIGEATKDEGAFAVLGMGNVADGDVVGPPSGRVDHVDPKLLLTSGDLLFNRTNSLALVGKVGMYLDAPGTTTFASYLVRLRTNHLAHPHYLNFLLNTPEWLGLARSVALPSIGQANLNPNRYGDLEVVLPPPDEQTTIVRELEVQQDRLSTGSTALARQIDLLAEHRQALITAAVTGELAVPGVGPSA